MYSKLEIRMAEAIHREWHNNGKCIFCKCEGFHSTKCITHETKVVMRSIYNKENNGE